MKAVSVAKMRPMYPPHRNRLQLTIAIAFLILVNAQPLHAALQVLSSNPSNGAVNVSVNLTGVSITFNDEVSTKSSGYSTETDFWGPLGPTQWEGTTLKIFRFTQTPLPVGATIRITLNSIYDKLGNPFPYTLSFMVGTAVDLIPAVAATSPADGAVGVSRDLEAVTVTFTEPMDDCCHSISHNFPSYSVSYSADHKVMTLTRTDTQKRLAAGVTYTFNLLGGGTGGFRDTQGNRLPDTTFSFTTAEDYDAQILKIDANPAKGFEWPYYLSIPDALSSSSVLLVEPNNTGTVSDDLLLHDAAALSLVKWWTDFAVELDVPLLVPTFPRPATPAVPGGIYTHALDRYSLQTDLVIDGSSLQRIDLQLIAMIRDAQERLAAMGFKLASKVFMKGFSASGAFTSRFTLLHPEIVLAAAPGSPGGWPLAPVTAWWGIALRYPVGVSDVETLTGAPINLSAVRKIPQYIYVGDYDQNDALDTRGFPQAEVDVICSHLDCRPSPYISDRWPIAESMYESVDIAEQFVVYPGIAHTISDDMYADLIKFFKAHKLSKPRAMPWVPLLLD